VTYALSTKQLGGVFMWELSQDYNGQNQPLMDAMYGAFAQAAKARAEGAAGGR
jgi:GH18 family chitinase